MKYPPFSWLRLSDEIRKPQCRLWFSFDKLPSGIGDIGVKVQISGPNGATIDPYDAISHNLLLHRQKKVLEIFLKIAKPSKNKSEFLMSPTGFSRLLPYCNAVPFEIVGLGVLSFSKQNASIKARLHSNTDNHPEINFSLMKGMEAIENPVFFGDINAFIIDENAKLYALHPPVTPEEADSILRAGSLPLVGLCQKESRDIFYTLSRIGIDFSCLIPLSLEPETAQIVLRLILSIDDITKRMMARVHLVNNLTFQEYEDEVEIKSTGALPNLHIMAHEDLDEEKFVEDIPPPKLLRRPLTNEQNARNFLYHLGAGPARLHDGFELKQVEALKLLKIIALNQLPPYLKLDSHAGPEIIELRDKPTLLFKKTEDKHSRIDVGLSLSPRFDKTGATFASLIKAPDHILVVDEDTLAVADEAYLKKVGYIVQAFGLSKPGEFKSKSIAQVALLKNALAEQVLIEADEELLSLLAKFSITPQESDHVLPAGLKTTLRPYQHDAVVWLSSLYRSGLGGLLGDEMGLGKTLMVLTHLANLKEQGLAQYPALVVCPTSVMDVWQKEANTHIPSLRVMKWHGPERFLEKNNIQKTDILITSYAILRRDASTILQDALFSTLVLDEAQYVRNQQTDSFKSAKSIKANHRIALTGTPIENHIGDLFNILDCVEEGILGSRSQFEKQFGASSGDEDSLNRMTLKMLIAPIVTRRKKAEVESELPPKIESLVYCSLSNEQKSLYRSFMSKVRATIKNQNSSEKEQSQQHFTMLSALTRLRQISCHPSLVLGKAAQGHESGKLIALKEILKECLEMGRKIIIYSQFLKMQEMIVDLAKSLDTQGALWLHGSTKNREEIVDAFQNEQGPKIIVVSLKAGGTGITLTQADTVIFADPWWNPAVEDQAIDRAHRIGQKKTVHVIRLIAQHTIEDEVIALAQRKRQAAQSILSDGFRSAANLTKEEVTALLLHELSRLELDSDAEDQEDAFEDELTELDDQND